MPLIILTLLIAALVFAILAAFNMPSRFNMIGSALACYFLSLILPMLRTLFLITLCLCLVTGCATTTEKRAAPNPAAAPIAVVGNNFVNDAVEILEDYKDFKSGNTGWLYTLEKGLHAYGSVTQSIADAKVALKPFVDSKGQPFLDRLMLLLKKKPDVPLETKMAAVAQLADHVAADKGP